jgi:hypothetical protein
VTFWPHTPRPLASVGALLLQLMPLKMLKMLPILTASLMTTAR